MAFSIFKKPKEQPRPEMATTTEVRSRETAPEETEHRFAAVSENTRKDQAELARRIQTQAVPRPVSQPPKTHLRRELEVVLAEDVFDFMKQTSPAQQVEIRRRGREVLDQVETMIKQTKVNIRKVIHLILAWLKLLPITNKYFLEQEAKIKAEKMLRIADENK